MAKLTGYVAAAGGVITDIDTTAKNELGTICAGQDDYGNTAEFIYLQGIGSTIAGSVVTYDETGITALIAANAIGPVAVAMAATVASTYGWYCRTGTVYVDMVANTADNKNLGRETTDGKVGDGFATGDMIGGLVSRGSTSSAALQYAQATRPFVSDQWGA